MHQQRRNIKLVLINAKIKSGRGEATENERKKKIECVLYCQFWNFTTYWKSNESIRCASRYFDLFAGKIRISVLIKKATLVTVFIAFVAFKLHNFCLLFQHESNPIFARKRNFYILLANHSYRLHFFISI